MLRAQIWMQILPTTLPRPFPQTTARIVIAEPQPESHMPKPEPQHWRDPEELQQDQAEPLSMIGSNSANIFYLTTGSNKPNN